MPRKAHLNRQPINERVNGRVSLLDGDYLLSDAALPDADAVAAGELCLRYGIPYFFKRDLTIVPDLLALDRGETLNGEAAWQFLMESSHLYPRSDLIGIRSDGVDEMVPFKQLDFDSPYAVFAYADASDDEPIAELAALITADATAYPKRLLRHLPVFPSLNDWRAHG